MAVDYVPLRLKELGHKSKKVVPTYKTGTQVESKKLKRTGLLKNNLRWVFLMLDYRLLKESWLIITIAGPTVASKKDQNSKEVDTICGNKSIGNNKPTKILCEKSVLGNNNRPKNRPKNMDIIAFFSSNFRW